MNVPVTFSGSNLATATAITGLGNSGITVTNFAASANSVTATLHIPSNSALTTRALGLTTSIGTTNTETFQIVNPPQPTLTSVSPNSGVRGTGISVTLTGSNFTNTGTGVSVSGGGVNVSNVTFVDSSHITATFTFNNNATPGARNVTVTTPGGFATLTGGFVLQPTLTSISPSSLARGATNQTITFTGTGLSGATQTAGLAGGGVTIIAGSFTASATQVTVRVTVSATANTGPRTVSVVTNNGNTNTQTFTVTP